MISYCSGSLSWNSSMSAARNAVRKTSASRAPPGPVSAVWTFSQHVPKRDDPGLLFAVCESLPDVGHKLVRDGQRKTSRDHAASAPSPPAFLRGPDVQRDCLTMV